MRSKQEMVFSIVVLSFREERRPLKALPRVLRLVGVDNESNQVSKGRSVDALALRGEEGRGTLR
jgi:hypothetical protein